MNPSRAKRNHQPSAADRESKCCRERDTFRASGNLGALLHFSAVLGVLVLLALSVSACTSRDAEQTVSTDAQGLERTISEAERSGGELVEDPATFISLCVNCHDRLDRELDWRRQRKLVFNHQVHFANGIRCAACHHEFPHRPGRTIHVAVETCFLCHGRMHGSQGQLAPAGCDVCHTSDIAQTTPAHAAEDWLLVAGSEKAEHGRQALDRPLFCRMCHEDESCLECHGVFMPHPKDWTGASHRETDAQERAACSMCHSDPSFCNDCHHAGYTELPDWRAGHRATVWRDGADSCYECHSVPSCEECHMATSRERGVWSN